MQKTGNVHHTKDRPDSGMKTNIFITPADVSFANIQVREQDVKAVATGVYAPFNGVGHNPNPNPVPVNGVVAGLGSKVTANDNVYSGDPGTPAPFAPGAITFKIPWEFKVGSGALKVFATETQTSSLAADQVTLSSAKAGAFVTCKVSDPTSTP
jgi:hypothetical protein